MTCRLLLSLGNALQLSPNSGLVLILQVARLVIRKRPSLGTLQTSRIKSPIRTGNRHEIGLVQEYDPKISSANQQRAYHNPEP